MEVAWLEYADSRAEFMHSRFGLLATSEKNADTI